MLFKNKIPSFCSFVLAGVVLRGFYILFGLCFFLLFICIACDRCKNNTVSADQLNHRNLLFDIWWKMTAANLTQRCRYQFKNFVLSCKQCIWNESKAGILCRLIWNCFINSLGIYPLSCIKYFWYELSLEKYALAFM